MFSKSLPLALGLGLFGALSWSHAGAQPQPQEVAAAPEPQQAPGCRDAQGRPVDLPVGPVYVLGDSIAYGLAQERLALVLRKHYGVPMHINFDSGRSIDQPGLQSRTSALDAVALDQAIIRKARTVVVILGSNQTEASFANSVQALMWQLKGLAPDAHYFWVDIGATLANQAAAWSARNRVLYELAPVLGYRVISRYRAIFGADADPLAIEPGRNFPGLRTEPGYGAPGNLHGASAQLAHAVLQSLVELGRSLQPQAGMECHVEPPKPRP